MVSRLNKYLPERLCRSTYVKEHGRYRKISRRYPFDHACGEPTRRFRMHQFCRRRASANGSCADPKASSPCTKCELQLAARLGNIGGEISHSHRSFGERLVAPSLEEMLPTAKETMQKLALAEAEEAGKQMRRD